MSSSQQQRLPDLVRDSQLTTQFHRDGTTQHTVYSIPSNSGRRRRVRTEEVWRRKRELGSGAFGRVWLERCLSGIEPGTVRAVKEIQKAPAVSMVDYSRELEAVAKFSHKRYVHCFVNCYGWYESASSVFIAMEYLEHGDLQKYLHQRFPEAQARDIVSQLVEGLDYMHENGFAHRDLKPANVLVHRPAPDWWVKIGDFGISKRAEQDSTALRTLIGTEGYLAPEVIGFIFDPNASPDSFSYTSAVDMWALGEMSYRLVAQSPAFPSKQDLFRYVVHGQAFPRSALAAAGVSQDCRDFIAKAMTADPNHRLTARQANEHAWIRDDEPEVAITITEPAEEKSADDELVEAEFEDTARWSTGVPDSEEFPTLHPLASQDTPKTPSSLSTAQSILRFQEIMEIPTREERIEVLDVTRTQFQDFETGLDAWMWTMMNQHEEFVQATSSFDDDAPPLNFDYLPPLPAIQPPPPPVTAIQAPTTKVQRPQSFFGTRTLTRRFRRGRDEDLQPTAQWTAYSQDWDSD